MPGTTTYLNLRYPLATEAPDGAGGIYNLASDVDSALGSLKASGNNINRNLSGTTKTFDSPWTSYNPSTSGLSGSSNSYTFQWKVWAGEILVAGIYRFGSGGTVSGDVKIATPAPIGTAGSSTPVNAEVVFYDTSGNPSAGFAYSADANTFGIRTPSGAVLSSSTPFTWGNGAAIVLRANYAST